jgi:hypothetical protein
LRWQIELSKHCVKKKRQAQGVGRDESDAKSGPYEKPSLDRSGNRFRASRHQRLDFFRRQNWPTGHARPR